MVASAGSAGAFAIALCYAAYSVVREGFFVSGPFGGSGLSSHVHLSGNGIADWGIDETVSGADSQQEVVVSGDADQSMVFVFACRVACH